MSFLIFNNESEARQRSEDAGKAANLGFHSGDADGCRYVWPIINECGEFPRSALDLEGMLNLLTEQETEQIVEELPSDWTNHVDP